jgi:hypothetical protein
MKIEKPELISAAEKAGISKTQAEELWVALEGKAGLATSKFDLPHLLYYFGAMIVIVAMGWFVGVAWESFGGGGILCVALAYMLIFLGVGAALWKQESLKVPGGLFITMAVSMIPLAVYGFQRWTGWWVTGEPGQYKDFVSWVNGGWFAMEAATIIGGSIALKFYRFPFLTAPIFFTLWFMSMDAAPLIFKNPEYLWENRLWVSLGFGALLLIVAFLMDLSFREDFAFWGYLFGVITFWTGLSLLETASELGKFFYCLINVVLVLLSVFFQRTVFLIFGSIGILGYITSLFYRYFSDSIWFPVMLSLIGLLVIFIGLKYHKNRQKIDSFLLNWVPQRIKPWLPKPK